MAERCEQITAKGTQCQNRAYADTDRCFAHQTLRPVGRPTLLSETVTSQLCAMLRAGNYLHVAVKAAGISRGTFDRWIQQSKGGDPTFVEFADRIDRARAEGQARHVALIAKSATEDWRAAAWLLERSHPQLWAGVSVRMRSDESSGTEEPVASSSDDPFAEVDELAQRRRQRD